MADNVVLGAAVGTGATISTDDIGAGIEVQRVKAQFGADGSATDVSSANPFPVVQTGTPGLPTGASTAAKQPALGTAGTPSTDVLSVQGVAGGTAVPVSGTVTASGPLTDTQLRATPVPVSGTVTASGPLTDTQLRATPVPVSGTVTANLGTAAVTNAGTFAVQATGNVGLAAAAGAAGLSKSHTVAANSTNATTVKASAGKLHGWYIYNSNIAARKVAFHNTAGTPTAGSGVTDSIVIPPAAAANAFTDIGIAFSTGIAFTTVTGLADSDNTAVAANDLVINLYYV